MSFLGFGKKTIKNSFNHAEGISHFSPDSLILVTLDDLNNQITMKERVFRTEPCHLKYEQIFNIELISESDFKTPAQTEQKSVIGRAIVGGILFGGIGSIVGGMSGVGQKKLSTNKEYVLIQYHPQKNPNETKRLILKTLGSVKAYTKILDELKLRCNIKKIEESVNSGCL